MANLEFLQPFLTEETLIQSGVDNASTYRVPWLGGTAILKKYHTEEKYKHDQIIYSKFGRNPTLSFQFGVNTMSFDSASRLILMDDFSQSGYRNIGEIAEEASPEEQGILFIQTVHAFAALYEEFTKVKVYPRDIIVDGKGIMLKYKPPVESLSLSRDQTRFYDVGQFEVEQGEYDEKKLRTAYHQLIFGTSAKQYRDGLIGVFNKCVQVVEGGNGPEIVTGRFLGESGMSDLLNDLFLYSEKNEYQYDYLAIFFETIEFAMNLLSNRDKEKRFIADQDLIRALLDTLGDNRRTILTLASHLGISYSETRDLIDSRQNERVSTDSAN